MVIIVVAVARVDGFEGGVGLARCDVIARERWNHESVNEVVIEEFGHVHWAVVGVDRNLLVLQFFFHRRNVVLDLDQQIAAGVAEGVRRPSLRVVSRRDRAAQRQQCVSKLAIYLGCVLLLGRSYHE